MTGCPLQWKNFLDMRYVQDLRTLDDKNKKIAREDFSTDSNPSID